METVIFQKYYQMIKNHNKHGDKFVPNGSLTDKEGKTRFKLGFLLDITGSMEVYIEAVKTELKSMIEKLRNDVLDTLKLTDKTDITMEELKNRLIFEVAIVGYRDIKDYVQYEIIDFTDDMEKIILFLDHIIASGGQDAPENVKGAHILALNIGQEKFKLSWEDTDDIRHLVWIADAPPHGKIFFNNFYGDDFPDDCIEEWDLIFKHIRVMKIHYHILKIHNQTSDTCDYFKNNYDINSIDLTQQYKDTPMVISLGDSASLSDSVHLSERKVQGSKPMLTAQLRETLSLTSSVPLAARVSAKSLI